MTPDQARQLRAPFPPEAVGQLPKGGIMLDYVGHAATTNRLLEVDPEWTWEPMAKGPNGEPLMTNGGLWITLTVCGVTRPGFGDGKNPKEIIGDAIRNAAMRFGVALDLWSKEDLGVQNGKPASVLDDPAIPFGDAPAEELQPPMPSKAMLKKLDVLIGKLRPEHVSTLQLYQSVGREPVLSTEDGILHWSVLRDSLTRTEAHDLIDRLDAYEKKIGVTVPYPAEDPNG